MDTNYVSSSAPLFSPVRHRSLCGLHGSLLRFTLASIFQGFGDEWKSSFSFYQPWLQHLSRAGCPSDIISMQSSACTIASSCVSDTCVCVCVRCTVYDMVHG
jgi:hypothetical protein